MENNTISNLTNDEIHNMDEVLTMNVKYEENPMVSARELHGKLNIGTEFAKWFSRMCEYGFSDSEDYYEVIVKNDENPKGGRPATDYNISLDMAKHICMIQRTPEGKKVRQYLIDLEKAWNTPEQVMARALDIAHKTIDKVKRQNIILLEDCERMKPKEEFFDAVAGSKDAIEIAKVAKVLNHPNVGRKKLFEILRKKGVLMNDNIPYQKYIDNGCFRIIEQKYTTPYGETKINIKTLVYQKGVDFIRKLLEAS